MKYLKTLIATSLRKIVLPSIIVIVCSGASLQARADTLRITGLFGISHTGIDFLPLFGGTGTLTVDPGSTGIFGPLVGTAGTARDLTTGAAPVGVPLSLQSFLTFGANQNLRFDLTFLNLGGLAQCGSPVVGQTCTAPPALNELNLTNLGGGNTSLTFSLQGNVVDIATNQVTPFTGTFSTQIGSNIPQFLVTINSGNFVTASYSAILTTNSVPESAPVPEPATMLLLGSGLAGVFISRRVRSGRFCKVDRNKNRKNQGGLET